MVFMPMRISATGLVKVKGSRFLRMLSESNRIRFMYKNIKCALTKKMPLELKRDTDTSKVVGSYYFRVIERYNRLSENKKGFDFTKKPLEWVVVRLLSFVPLVEFLNSTSCIHEYILSSVKGMRSRANFHFYQRIGLPINFDSLVRIHC